jgi:hypothetical protein
MRPLVLNSLKSIPRRRGDRRRPLTPLRLALEMLESRALLAAGDVLGNHYDAGSSGQTLSESVLTPALVSSSQVASSISTNFGRLFDTTLDGQVYAQPLAVANVNITRGAFQGIHNVLYVATMHNSLYAVDAGTGVILWQDNFNQITDPRVATIGSPVVTAGVTTIPSVSGNNPLVNGNDIGPELGILATPTIDPSSHIIYLVADSKELRNGTTPSASGADTHWVQRLWAINIADGSIAITPTLPPGVAASGGQTIADTILNGTSYSSYTNYKYVAGPYIKGTGNNTDTFNANGTVATTNNADGWVVNTADPGTIFAGTTPSATGYIAFNGLLQMNRVATTLVNGEIYLGFASHGDDGPYYGWLLGYNATTLTNNAAFVTVPTFDGVKGSAGFTSVGGLWGSGATIATDGTYLYFTVGNGSFNNATTNFSANYYSLDGANQVLQPLDGDYGDSVLKVAFDPNATQTNINLKNDAANPANPTPDGTYNPDGGYNQSGYGLKVVDYFAPSNVRVLNINDEDLGSSGTLLIPTTGPGAATAPNGDQMLVVSGKEGRVYLIDTGNMGGFNTQYVTDGHDQTGTAAITAPAPYDRVLGEYYYRQANGNPTIYANDQTNKGYEIPSYSNGVVYFGLSGGKELGFNVANLIFPAGPASSRTATYSTPVFSTSASTPSRGATAALSSNSLSNPILWNNWVALTMTDATLTTALNNGQTGITTLAISPLATALTSGNVIKIQAPNSSSSQTVTLSSNAARNATTLSVTSFTASSAYPVGSVITLNGSSQDFLVAYDSSANVIFNSNWSIVGAPNNLSDSLTNGVPGATGSKFSIPTVFNGLVYSGTGGGSSTSNSHNLGTIVGYGLLSPTLHQPTGLATQAISPNQVHLSWTRNAADSESGTRVERSLNGSTWTTIQIVHNGATNFDDTTVAGGTQYFYRVTEIYGSSSSSASAAANLTTPNYPKGDYSLDHIVNAADISAMSQALCDLATFQSSHGLSDADFLFLADVNGDQVVNNADIQAELHLLIAGAAGGSGPAAASIPAADEGMGPISSSAPNLVDDLAPPIAPPLTAQPAVLAVANGSAGDSAVTSILTANETDSAPANSPKELAESESIVFVSMPQQTTAGTASMGKAVLDTSEQFAQVDSGTHLDAVDFALGFPIEHRDRHFHSLGESGRRTSDALDELFASWP